MFTATSVAPSSPSCCLGIREKKITLHDPFSVYKKQGPEALYKKIGSLPEPEDCDCVETLGSESESSSRRSSISSNFSSSTDSNLSSSYFESSVDTSSCEESLGSSDGEETTFTDSYSSTVLTSSSSDSAADEPSYGPGGKYEDSLTMGFRSSSPDFAGAEITFSDTLDMKISAVDQPQVVFSNSVTKSLDDQLEEWHILKSYLLFESSEDEIPENQHSQNKIPTEDLLFTGVTSLAKRLFHVPFAQVSLVDLCKDWFLSMNDAPDVSNDDRRGLSIHKNGLPFHCSVALVAPEGVYLGYISISDLVRRQDLLEDSYNLQKSLQDLAALAVELLSLRRLEYELRKHSSKAKGMAARISHDLLTPLSGIQMSLSLLQENDDQLGLLLSDQSRALIKSASYCEDLVERLCRHTIQTLRGNCSSGNSTKLCSVTSCNISVSSLIEEVTQVMSFHTRPVQFNFWKNANLTEDLFISNCHDGDELKIERCLLNILTHICNNSVVTCAEKAEVNVSIFVARSGFKRKSRVIFETQCVAIKMADNTDYFGIDSVSAHIQSITGGRNGSHLKKDGSITFWYSLPLQDRSEVAASLNQADLKLVHTLPANAHDVQATLSQEKERLPEVLYSRGSPNLRVVERLCRGGWDSIKINGESRLLLSI